MNGIVVVFLVASLILLVVVFVFGRLAFRLSLKLPQIESFFPQFSPMKVRTSAFLIGVVLWTGIGTSLLTGSAWQTLRPEFIMIPKEDGELARPVVSSTQARKARAAMRDLNAAQDASPPLFDSEEYGAAARQLGFFRLSDLLEGRAPKISGKTVLFQSVNDLVPAFRLTEQMSFDDQPVWRSWLSRTLKKEGAPLVLQSTLWCGFDLSKSQATRFCIAGLPLPIIVRLFPDAEMPGLSKEVTLAAPTVLLRLDAQGARIVGNQLAHSRYEKRTEDKITFADLGLSFEFQGQNNPLTWNQIMENELVVTVAQSKVSRIKAHQWLWSKRALKGEDRWLFAQRDEGMPDLTRHLGAPRIWRIAHDFLKPMETARASADLSDWAFGLLFVTAVNQFDKNTPRVCGELIRDFAQNRSATTGYGDIQVQRPGNKQAVFLDEIQCPGEILSLFLNGY